MPHRDALSLVVSSSATAPQSYAVPRRQPLQCGEQRIGLLEPVGAYAGRALETTGVSAGTDESGLMMAGDLRRRGLA